LLSANADQLRPSTGGAAAVPPPGLFVGGIGNNSAFDDDYATLHGVQSDEHDRLRWLVALTRHRAELAVARSTCLRRKSAGAQIRWS